MFKTITDTIEYPSWTGARFKRLDVLDRVLDGTLYDHLPNDFYTEEGHNGEYIPIQQRRPSVNSGFASQIVGVLARKLFSGRHAPRITHDNEEYAELVRTVIAQGSVYEKMLTAAIYGSVGSVAMTFAVIDGVLRVDVWRAKYCRPVFSRTGALSALRVCYTTGGAALLAEGFTTDAKGQPITDSYTYWYAREYGTQAETTFTPISDDDWNPEEYSWDVLTPQIQVEHNFGFVPGVWITNAPGGVGYDGNSTFGSVVNNIIEMDYTLSQLGRGIRYSAAPQLAVIGDMDNGDDFQRGPSMVLKLRTSRGDGDEKIGASDAKLLEMVGNGTQVGINYIEELRKLTLEAISASIKKHEIKGALSGRAMEVSDDAFYDLAHMLRNRYGDSGLVPLVSKIMIAFQKLGMLPIAISDEELTAFGLRWPRLYPSTPSDELQMVESLVMASQNGLIDIDTAKSYLWAQMDLEDYRVATPPQTETNEGNTDAPVPGEPGIEDDKYNEGINTDPRRPGPQGHMLPKRRVGGKQITID